MMVSSSPSLLGDYLKIAAPDASSSRNPINILFPENFAENCHLSLHKIDVLLYNVYQWTFPRQLRLIIRLNR